MKKFEEQTHDELCVLAVALAVGFTMLAGFAICGWLGLW